MSLTRVPPTNGEEEGAPTRAINSPNPSSQRRSSMTEGKRSDVFRKDSMSRTDCVDQTPQKILCTQSFNISSKSTPGKEEPKRLPSRIPRSKSRNRTESETVKYDLQTRTEELNDRTKKENEKTEVAVATEDKELEENKEDASSKIISKINREESFKSTMSSKVQQEDDRDSFKDSFAYVFKDMEEGMNSAEGVKESKKPTVTCPKLVGEKEEKRQDKIVKNLYETITTLKESLFESLKWISDGKGTSSTVDDQRSEAKVTQGPETDGGSVQNFYERTLSEISDIWTNAISIINMVKDHAHKFFEEEEGSIDREQLSLEAEMLQLAVDFSIGYSKLKTDFFLKKLRKRLNVREMKKTDLENFMDSRVVAAMYNDEDLIAMAKTVRDLNNSLLKGGAELE